MILVRLFHLFGQGLLVLIKAGLLLWMIAFTLSFCGWALWTTVYFFKRIRELVLRRADPATASGEGRLRTSRSRAAIRFPSSRRSVVDAEHRDSSGRPHRDRA